MTTIKSLLKNDTEILKNLLPRICHENVINMDKLDQIIFNLEKYTLKRNSRKGHARQHYETAAEGRLFEEPFKSK